MLQHYYQKLCATWQIYVTTLLLHFLDSNKGFMNHTLQVLINKNDFCISCLTLLHELLALFSIIAAIGVIIIAGVVQVQICFAASTITYLCMYVCMYVGM